jgi:hypothetical protein
MVRRDVDRFPSPEETMEQIRLVGAALRERPAALSGLESLQAELIRDGFSSFADRSELMSGVNTEIEAGDGVATIAVRDRLAASVERRLLPPAVADIAQSQLDAHADELEELRSALGELGMNQNQVGVLEAALDGNIATAASITGMGDEAEARSRRSNCKQIECLIWWWLNLIPSHYCYRQHMCN